MQRFSAAWDAFKDPGRRFQDLSKEDRQTFYWSAFEYYRQTMFSRRNGEDWSYYLAARELYKHTRLIYNPVPQIVDFYVDNIWQSADNEDFESLVTPLTEKTDDKIVAAVAQLDQWGNFLSEGQKIKRYCAATGNVLIEGIDDLERQKILHHTIWPGFVSAIELNATGDVIGYTLEYEVTEKGGDKYRYKKIVDREKFQYFRDDQPFVFEGKTAAVEANPYGFVFAVWLRHVDDGGDYGLPACHSLDKVDNLNSLASHLDDYVHKAIESPKVVSTDSEMLPIIGATFNSTTKIITPSDPRLNWVVFKTAAGASVHDLSGMLKLAECHPHLKMQLESFNDDYPELQAAAIIRENSQLSGAALERMLTPAQNRLDSSQANYNQQWIKFRQMGIAVAGMRLSNGWRGITEQQRQFQGFGLDSYQKGELDFNLKPSVLVSETETEKEELLMAKANRAVVLAPMVKKEEQLSIAGYSEDKIPEVQSDDVPPPAPGVVPAGLPENRQLEAVN
jgi:hypothetical protein